MVEKEHKRIDEEKAKEDKAKEEKVKEESKDSPPKKEAVKEQKTCNVLSVLYFFPKLLIPLEEAQVTTEKHNSIFGIICDCFYG